MRRQFDAVRKQLSRLAKRSTSPRALRALGVLGRIARTAGSMNPYIRALTWLPELLDLLDGLGGVPVPGPYNRVRDCGYTPTDPHTLYWGPVANIPTTAACPFLTVPAGYVPGSGATQDYGALVAQGPNYIREFAVQVSPSRFMTLGYQKRLDYTPAEIPWLLPEERVRYPRPNLDRYLPTLPEAQEQPEAGQPVPGTEVEPQPETQPERAPHRSVSVGADDIRASAPHIRVRPPETVREGKYISRSKALVIAMFGALDKISEASEVVDAAYSALPEAVRKRWDAKYSDNRGPVDAFGQYGIAGADWKLQALYHNYEKINVEAFVANVVKNHLEDKVIGAIQSKLPKNTGNALEQGEQAFGEWLNAGLDKVLPS